MRWMDVMDHRSKSESNWAFDGVKHNMRGWRVTVVAGGRGGH